MQVSQRHVRHSGVPFCLRWSNHPACRHRQSFDISWQDLRRHLEHLEGANALPVERPMACMPFCQQQVDASDSVLFMWRLVLRLGVPTRCTHLAPDNPFLMWHI